MEGHSWLEQVQAAISSLSWQELIAAIKPGFLQGEQNLSVTGISKEGYQDKTWCTTRGDMEHTAPSELTCNAEEADTRVWLHV